ncbi:hypothetical protein SAMN05216303_1142 [Rhodoferax sp. OV413]|uniref:hypothetical protein n=1 Tax=Rhodoferax sp. OV413 TaxID=1855285 RepID=UPI0008904B24|nr:hypothetical protein [Rhodoferax sp. OV413]SDP94165.1 hypothetical protein SAMN05216303_1142 [Rhodoferax sp. OV413]
MKTILIKCGALPNGAFHADSLCHDDEGDFLMSLVGMEDGEQFRRRSGLHRKNFRDFCTEFAIDHDTALAQVLDHTEDIDF